MSLRRLFPALALAAVSSGVLAASEIRLSFELIGPARQGAVAEWRIEGVPAATNVFDPDVIAVDVEFTTPAGETKRVPAFWFRDYARSLQGANETLTPRGGGEWRVRYRPAVEGTHWLRGVVRTNGAQADVEGDPAGFDIAAGNPQARGQARIAEGNQYFETTDGRPLPLMGADVCWHGSRGTRDYDDWFPAMANAGWNWTRLWMCPWAFGIETAPEERLNYRLDRAWQLDHVFRLAEERGIFLLLCLDYHGMFETEPDFWGGNNLWPRHPYNQAHGGPCATQRDFFTNASARELYQKRLRYLIARYGASPALFAWEFFNEIDNVYRHLTPADVARWHQDMGEWLKANDPWGHLVTTSLTGGSDRADIWQLPALDFACYHSYAEAAPARRLAEVVGSMRERYGKPVIIAEAGVDWRGWNRESDPHLRGFRQLLWGGVTSGSAGTSMSWWWESIHSENAYPVYHALSDVLAGANWGDGVWNAAQVQKPEPMPDAVGEVLEGPTFNATLPLDAGWGSQLSGRLAIASPVAAGHAARHLNAFVHGSAHSDLRRPFVLDAWFGGSARMVMHLNSVSAGAVLAVYVDGARVFQRSLPNKDGGWNVNNEYNEDISVELPEGHHRVEIRNLGSDWFNLDWVRLESVRPAAYAGGWQPAPAITGIQRGGEVLLYAVAPGVEYPSQATEATLPECRGATLTISNLPAGDYAVMWFHPKDGTEAGRGKATADASGVLRVGIPDFREDLVAHVFTPPTLRPEGVSPDGAFFYRSEGARVGEFAVEASADLREWSEVEEGGSGSDPDALARRGRFFRLRLRRGRRAHART